MNTARFVALKCSVLCMALLLLLAACGPPASPVTPQATVTISNTFQSQVSPIPTVPAYPCAALPTNNAPAASSTITIHAHPTNDIPGVTAPAATAVVHVPRVD